jgi:hypothetical protein
MFRRINFCHIENKDDHIWPNLACYKAGRKLKCLAIRIHTLDSIQDTSWLFPL